jgi:hypothetical protein
MANNSPPGFARLGGVAMVEIACGDLPVKQLFTGPRGEGLSDARVAGGGSVPTFEEFSAENPGLIPDACKKALFSRRAKARSDSYFDWLLELGANPWAFLDDAKQRSYCQMLWTGMT